MREEPFFTHVRLRTDGLDNRAYPLSIKAVQQMESIRFHPAVTVFAGENGMGKSTLVEAIAIAAGFNEEGGRKSFRTVQTSTDISLADRITFARTANREQDGFFLRAESTYVLANYINSIPEYVHHYGGNLHAKSHGESFMSIFRSRFRSARNSLFILDEVESALSPQRQIEFLGLMREHIDRGSMFIVSTHSPILMSYPQSRLYWLDQKGIEERNWMETDHYKVYYGFINRPERALQYLLGSSKDAP